MREQRTMAPDRVRKRLGPGGGHGRTEHVAEGIEWRDVLVHAAAAQHPPTPPRRIGGNFRCQAGCADAWRAGEEEHAARAHRRAVEHHPDVEALLLAADETIAGRE